MTSENVRCEKAFYRAIVINYTFVFFFCDDAKICAMKKETFFTDWKDNVQSD